CRLPARSSPACRRPHDRDHGGSSPPREALASASVRVDRPTVLHNGLRLAEYVEVVAERLPRGPRRGCLGLLLRSPFALSPTSPHHPARREETLRVVWSLVPDPVSRQLGEVTGDELLQPRLVVLPARTLTRFADAVAQQLEHQSLRCRPTALEVHRAQH